jgi:hypothetical protein
VSVLLVVPQLLWFILGQAEITGIARKSYWKSYREMH